MTWKRVSRDFRFREALSFAHPWIARLDAKDFRLLVALHEDARSSYRALGRRVSLTAPAVRERLHRLESKGVFHGFWLTPDPGVLDRRDLIVLFPGEWTRADAEKALQAPDVAWVAWKVDGAITVQLWPRDVDGAVEELSRILGATASSQTLADPGSHALLSQLDWRIMDALVDDPRLPVRDLCARTRLSPKTVRKHLRALLRDRSIYITPKLGSFGEAGEIVFPLLVYGSAHAADVRRAIGDSFLLNSAESPPMMYLLCRAPDMNEITVRLQAVQKVRGVESAAVTLNRDLLIDRDYIHTAIREQMTVVSGPTPTRTREDLG